MITIKLTNKVAYTLILILAVLSVSLVVYATNPTTKSNPGHFSQEVTVNIAGTDKTLQAAIDDGDFGVMNTLDTGVLDAKTEGSNAETNLISQGCVKLNNEDARYDVNKWMACPKNYYVAAVTDDDTGAEDVFCCPFKP